MTINKIGSVNQLPLYVCTSCISRYEDCTWPAGDLRVHSGECWCYPCWDARQDAYPEQPAWSDLEPYTPALQAECEALRKDAGRLDFLDARNRPLKMGWSVSDAPAGNVSIMSMNVSIVSIMSIGGREPTSIRSAIDAAMAKDAEK